jgi:c-di-GMP-binding flagellar brake protein YcgR
MANKGMSEKRKFARLSIKVPIRWKIVTPDSETVDPKLDITRDISRGGICFKARNDIKAGTVLHLEIKLPNQKIINAQGRVVWSKDLSIERLQKEVEFDIGVEFLEIRDTDREEINKFVFEYLTHP